MEPINAHITDLKARAPGVRQEDADNNGECYTRKCRNTPEPWSSHQLVQHRRVLEVATGRPWRPAVKNLAASFPASRCRGFLLLTTDY